MAGHSESGNEPMGSIKHLKFLDCLKMYLLLKKNYAPKSQCRKVCFMCK